MSKQYWEKLKDPRWQRLRLEAMSAAEFACQVCYDSKSTLNVHHKQYFKGREPWEYEVMQLSVLCESCHEEQHSDEDQYRLVGSYLSLDGPGSRDCCASLVAGFARIAPPTKNGDMYSYFLGIIARLIEPVTWQHSEEFSGLISDAIKDAPLDEVLRQLADLVEKERDQ
jgi:hypothetical protein